MTSAAPRLSRVSLASAAAMIALAASGAASAAAADYYLKLDGVPGESKAAGDKWFIADSFSFGVEREMKESGEKGGTEDINIGVGELQEARKAGDVTLKRGVVGQAAQSDKATPKLAESVARGKTFGKPLPRGSLTVMVPLGRCAVGTRYPSAELGTPGRTYQLRNLTIAACNRTSSGGVPMEQISLNYEEIK